MRMEYYRLRFRPRGVWLTPWQSDTLFGELCWALRYEEGEERLQAFLAPFLSGRPPFVLSNGFPGELMPRPVLPPAPAPASDKALAIAAMKAAKSEKAARWISSDVFHCIRRTGHVEPQVQRCGGLRRDVVIKNQINRRTGTTAPPGEQDEAAGNLYAQVEIGLPAELTEIAVYAAAESSEWAERLWALFGKLAHSGHGAKKSSGYGTFQIVGMDPLPDWSAPVDGANSFIALSNFAPAAGDPVDGYYEPMVKYGKLGEEFAGSAAMSPFKYPLLMVRAGAVFRTPEPRAWYGRMVRGVYPGDERIVQFAYTLALPMHLPD